MSHKKHPIKQADLDWVTDSLNKALAPTGVEFRWSRRYGYYAIDYKHSDDGGLAKMAKLGLATHRSGLTKSQAYEILYGMGFVANMTMSHKKTKAQEFFDYALGK